ncbi:MAG: hypothetical protein GY811_24040 [Myxococcales bacterium]|nr:hypothetical protein [Myxococcales bacterium]
MRVNDVANPGLSGPYQQPVEKSSKEEFLQLLVAQLENQNPLEPQSGADFIAQLAQFASVEQSEETNTLLADMRAEQVSASSAALAGFVGKNASFYTDTLHLDEPGEGIPAMSFETSSAAPEAKAVILDSEGNTIRSIDLGALPPGEHSLQWDGKDRLGQTVKEGDYRVEIRVEDADGNEVTVPTSVGGVIDSIDFSQGYPMMRIGGALLAPADVLSIG